LKIYFNANNKATVEALEECGVKNVMLSHRYSYASIDKFCGKFESIFVVPGSKDDPEKYHQFLKDKRDSYNMATQFDVYYDMIKTLKYLKDEREMGIDWTIPTLQQNYLQHIAQLRLEPNSLVGVGEIKGKYEMEDQIKKLPRNIRYHGLAKSKYVKDNIFDSVNTATWISGVLSKKTQVWNNGDTTTMFFGQRGRGTVPILRHLCEQHKDYLEMVGVTVDEIIDCDYSALLKAPIALLFMPQMKAYGYFEDNFK
jgi:hypothetical protein